MSERMVIKVNLPTPVNPDAVRDVVDLIRAYDELMRLLGASCLTWRFTEQAPGRFTFEALTPGDQHQQAVMAFKAVTDATLDAQERRSG